MWAAVSKEALSMIFQDADATGLEEDARLTAMWLWTLSTDSPSENQQETDEDDKTAKSTGFTLEFDAARKIAQGLGVHLETLTSLVEIKGHKARLLPVSERARFLFGKDSLDTPKKTKRKQSQQLSLPGMEEFEAEKGTSGAIEVENIGKTALDRIHQTMLLFATGRSDAMKRFLVEDSVGQDQRFWKLAQALSALYPSGTEEKRWIDGVLARKKGLGF